jgi:hypothetical protein
MAKGTATVPGVAPEIDELTVVDSPEAWRACGFAVEGDECVLGKVRVRLDPEAEGSGLAAWSLRGIDSTDFDGLPTRRRADSGRYATGIGPSAGGGGFYRRAPAHPNGIAAIDHLVAISSDLDRTVAALQAAGLDLRRVREEPTPAGAPRQAFFRLGAEILEVVQEPAEATERAGGDRPAFFWGLALLAPDLEATVASLGERVGEIRPAVQPGRRIATLGRSAGLALPLALLSPAPRD